MIPVGLWDNIKDGFKSGQAGKGPNYVRKQREARERAMRARLEGRWFSKYRESDGTIELMVDRDGNPTNTYPHVHVIHDELKGEVRLVLSLSPSNHPKRETLPGTASGNEVNAAIDRFVMELRMY
jgi:hypothetical protein